MSSIYFWMMPTSHRRTKMSSERVKDDVFRLAFALVLLAAATIAPSAWASSTTRSSSLALSEGSTRLFNVNFVSDSVTVFSVTGGGSTLQKTDEVTVGREPVSVAVRGQ